MLMLLFSVCLLASTVGAVVGAGGGVLIKPILDLWGVFPVKTVSFCSGITVLCMSLVSLLRTRNNGVPLKFSVSTPLAVGAVIGGIFGKWLLEAVDTFGSSTDANILGGVQAVCLTVITSGILVYVFFKDKISSKNISNWFVVLIIGLLLGLLSAFLGIGGGPYNVAILLFLFSMTAKEAAKNSLYHLSDTSDSRCSFRSYTHL